MKIIFNPSIKPWDILSAKKLEPIKCPECDSLKVWAHTSVHARAWVNLNTAEVEEPEDGEADLDDAREESIRMCYNCDHEWEV